MFVLIVDNKIDCFLKLIPNLVQWYSLFDTKYFFQQETDIIGFLRSDERFTTLLVAIEAAELVETLQGGKTIKNYWF